MLDGFTTNIITLVDLETFIINMIIALLCGLIISLFYKASYRGPHYSTSFVQALVVLSMVTSLVIMVIGNNLARAFGLVGAMSIIRFRTAVKDTQDIVFIFFSLAAGMAAGVGLKLPAFVGTIFIGSVLYFLSNSSFCRIFRTLTSSAVASCSSELQTPCTRLSEVSKSGCVSCTTNVSV